jgi:TonB family protein
MSVIKQIQEMNINDPSYVNILFAKFATYRPNQVAHLAGMFSLILHLGIWQAFQAAAMSFEPVGFSQQIEVTLMSETPKQVLPTEPIKPPLPAIVAAENIETVAIPLPVSEAMPIAKPFVRPIRKISKASKSNPPLVKLEKHSTLPKATDDADYQKSGGSAGGYGVASQTGQGFVGSIGLGGGLGNGAGGGSGPGSATGTGSGTGTGSDVDAYSEATFNANYATNPKPKYPEAAKSLGWEGNVLLRVRVTADGRSEQVIIHRSSGHKVLDDSAVVAVQNWRFIPAKRGSKAVACTVIVPIVFTLK